MLKDMEHLSEDLFVWRYQKFIVLFLFSFNSGTIAGIEYTARQHGPGKKSIAK